MKPSLGVIPNWSGLQFSRITTQSGVFPPAFDLTKPLLGLIVSGEHVASWRQCGKRYSHTGKVGSFSFMNAPTRISDLKEHASAEHIIVELDFHDLSRWSGIEYTPKNLVSHSGGTDGPIASIVLAMQTEVDGGCRTGSLYAQSLSMALLSYIETRFASGAIIAPSHGFSQRALRNVQEFIQCNLHKDISLTDLSSIVGLSPSHFCRIFKSSMNISPYQFVIHLRISRAKRLLSERELSIAEIALATGFANQSHFSDAFKRLAGTSPREFRANS